MNSSSFFLLYLPLAAFILNQSIPLPVSRNKEWAFRRNDAVATTRASLSTLAARVPFMRTRAHAKRRLHLQLEILESRLTPTGPLVIAPLDPALDQFGQQIVTVQAYGGPSHAAFSVFDSGAAAITFSAAEEAALASAGAAIPILNPGGAFAEGIGGYIT